MSRKNYAAAERALHVIGALAGKTRQEINDAIAHGDALKMVPVHRQKEIPEASFKTLTRYGAAVGLTPEVAGALWEHCTATKKLGDL